MIKKTVFAGFGGQGVLLMGYILAVACMRDGKYVTYLPSYGAEVRGGTANCTVSVGDEEIASPVASFPDYGVVLNKPSMLKYEGVIRESGLMLLNSSMIDTTPARDDIEVVKVPANELAEELGNERVLNIIMLGAFVQKTGLTSIDSIDRALQEVFKEKATSKMMKLNERALEKGSQFVLKGDRR